MAKKTTDNFRAIRAAACAGFVATTAGWQRFKDLAKRHSLYSVITQNGHYPVRKNYPGLGYLLLLEHTLGKTTFRQLCPLSLPADDPSFITELPDNERQTIAPLSDHSIRLGRFLWLKYIQLQRQRAATYWPRDIGPAIDLALEKTLPPVLPKPDLWPFCQAYLQIRYGLNGTRPITKGKRLIPAVLRQVDRNPKSHYCADVFGGEVVIDSARQTHHALKEPAVVSLLQEFARTFSATSRRKPRAQWLAITRKACAQPPGNGEPPHLGPNTVLAELMSVKTANALDQRGLIMVKDLENVTAEELLAIPNVGPSSVAEVKTALRQVLLPCHKKK